VTEDKTAETQQSCFQSLTSVFSTASF